MLVRDSSPILVVAYSRANHEGLDFHSRTPLYHQQRQLMEKAKIRKSSKKSFELEDP